MVTEGLSMRTMGRNEFKALLMQDAKEKRQLKYVAIELLDKCLYKCPHCYVKDKYGAVIDKQDFCRIVDQLVEKGCTWLLLTGGEPLLHPYFLDLYRYAWEKQLKIIVFSNGYLIRDEVLECFSKYPPDLVELTVYGGTPKSYDDYVGLQGAFFAFDNAVDVLIKTGIKTRLKSVLTPRTIKEIDLIGDYAEKKGIEFRYDGFVVPKIDGDMNPCNNYRLEPNDVFGMDVKIKGFLDAQIERQKQFLQKRDINELYSCDAAYNSIFIDASCKMSICTFARHICVQLSESVSIKEGQEYLINLIKSKRPLSENDKCFSCSKKAFCRYCPGQFLLENGDEYTPIKWRCEYAQLVLNAINERNKV